MDMDEYADKMEKTREVSVLLVEDNPGDADLICEMLAESSIDQMKVRQASRLQDALAQMRENSSDLVLLDLGLPDSNGLETVRTFCREMPDVPVVVLTGLDDDETGFAAATEGAQNYLVKGQITGEFLRRLVRNSVERERVQQKLQDSRNYLDLALRAAQMGTWDWNLLEDRLVWSAGHELLFGYAPGTFKGTYEEFKQRVHLEDIAGVEAAIEKAKATKTEYNHEFRVVWPDGSVHWIAGRGQFLYKDEQPYRMVGVVRDITERKLADEALRKERDFAKNLIDTAQVVVLVLSPEGRIVNFNPYFEEVSGYPLEELKGADWFDTCIPPDNREQVRSLFKQAIGGDPTRGNISPILTREGGLRQIEWYDNTLTDKDSNIIGLLATGQDVTEKQKMENERARLFTAVEAIPEGVLITDTSGNIVYANKGLEELTGYSQSEILGQNPRILKSGSQNDAFYKDLWDTISGREVWSGRFTNKRKDGTLYEEESTISPVFDVNGKIENYVGIKRDISEQLAAEKHNLQTQKLESLGTLAGGIAHDFNNLLGIIMGFGQMVVDDLPEDSPTRENMQEVMHATDRATGLVRQILTFSRHGDESRQPLQLQLIVKEAVKFLKSSIPSTISINADVAQECPMALADPTQMHQILMNLCTNAYHAMEDAGKLSITLKPFHVDVDFADCHEDLSEGEYLCLSISDTGTGIDPDVQERIFDPFFTTKPLGKGTGLGLATTHGIVKSHGGAIRVYSEPGKGTTFHIYLPVVEGESTKEREDNLPIPGGKEKVLVVDDEPAMAHTIEKNLMRLGYTVTCFTDSREALKVFREDPQEFDLIMTDQTMPEIPGDVLAREVLAIRPEMKIIINTGFSDHMTAEKAKQIGIRGFLMKPAEIRQIARMVRSVLDEKENA